MTEHIRAQYGAGEPLGAAYRLVELLGTGATGEVWRVAHHASGSEFAAKLLRAELAADPGIVERFVRERSVLLALQHPSIVRVRDLVVEGDRLAIVMDLVGGGSVRDLFVASGTLRPRDALTITAETLDALAAAHEQDVTHRDVKPDNVLLDAAWAPDATGLVRVTDFGIASVVAERERTTTGLLGTPQYMAPEAISHGRSGPAADVYGGGVMLYELLAGRTPFAGPGTDFAVAYRHVTSLPPVLDVPGPLWSAVSAMLAKDPAARPSAIEAAATLRRLARSLSGVPALELLGDPETFAEVERPATVVRGVGGAGPGSGSGPGTGSAAGPGAGPGADAGAGPDAGPVPELGPAGSRTVVRPMARQPMQPMPDDSIAASSRTGRFQRPDWLTNRALGSGALGVVLVAALVVGAVVWLPGAGGSTPGRQASAQAANAYQQDRPLPTGLTTTRKATLDPESGAIELTVTYTAQGATLSGPLVEVLPSARSDARSGGGYGSGSGSASGGASESACPTVRWREGDVTAARNQPFVTGVDTACAWSLTGARIAPGADVAVQATVRVPSVTDGASLQTWLDAVGTATTGVLTDQAVSGTAYPVQRLQDVVVQTPDRTVSQTTLPVTLVPVWPSGTDELNPLYRSPASGSPSQMLQDVAGGESGVRFADGCSGALAVSSDGLVVTALSVAPSCTVRASVGAFSDLESAPFGITTRN
ncbi:serine/threonine-protein kinase [Curtobacterium sp. Leaf183]|uniref:serine/threonine-protein kinase n=1 Tax=Curtobacterium sp. Leaf183 TaxID=1736291 RepID=UPI000B0D1587|nr:serine/threonine-protein kinase [Curtobacterium sp. Leaf183]